jgi:hypothetical protein
MPIPTVDFFVVPKEKLFCDYCYLYLYILYFLVVEFIGKEMHQKMRFVKRTCITAFLRIEFCVLIR